MVIYLDVLIIVNAILDYFLLNIMSKIVRRDSKTKRMIIASIIGGISSIYIFLDTGYLVTDLLYNIVVGGIMVLIVTGFKNFKHLLYSFAVFLLLSFMLSGFVDLLGRYFLRDVFLSENMISYIDISPIFLIISTAIIYVGICIFRRFSDKRLHAKSVELKIKVCDRAEIFVGLVDTGNSISDPFGRSQVFIIDSEKYNGIKESVTFEERAKRKRLIPVKTVGGRAILDAFRCDSAEIKEESRSYVFESPVIASSLEKIDNGYTAIIPSVCLDRIPDRK